MHYATFPTSGMLGVTACMLTQLGHPIQDADLARNLSLSCLFEQVDGIYRSGTALCTPKWINLALLPLGFRMEEAEIPADEVIPRLAALETAALELPVRRGVRRLVVYAGKAERRYRFINITLPDTREPGELLLTPGMLRKGLTDTVRLLTLIPCPPQPVDMKPYVIESLHVLRRYHRELTSLWETRLDRQQVKAIIPTHLRALFTYSIPMMMLSGNEPLYKNLLQLRRTLRPVIYGRLLYVHLSYYIPLKALDMCLEGLCVHIMDELYELGLPSAQADMLLHTKD